MTTLELGRLALLGSTNLDYLAMNFREVAASYGVGLQLYVPPYGQARQELLLDGGSSGLRQFDPSAVLVAEQTEALLGDLYWDPLGLAQEQRDDVLRGQLAPLFQIIDLARQRLRGTIFVLRPAVLHRSTLGQADATSPEGLRAIVARLNTLLEEHVSGLADVHLLDTEQLIADVGREAAMPRKYWHLGRVPFGNALGKNIAKRVIGALLALAGKTARLLVLDLDNTLWGGVLGEDGASNLKLGGAAPGSAFKDFQRVIKALSRRGIALAVCSKNDEDLAWKAIESHPEMVLRRSDFVAHRINWQSKAVNVAEILDELALGAQSCCFIDDNPVEREAVRRNVPGVLVPDLPADPTELVPWLIDYPFLECVALTGSDLKRTEQYKARARSNLERQQFADITDFYRDLQMQVRFEPYAELNQERIKQLLVKTNQFNATTRRHDGAKLAEMLRAGCEIYGVGLQDRNSSYELIGVLILEPRADTLEIDSFLLSCRVLGRTVETASLAWAAERGRAAGKARLIGTIVETERNTPVRKVYADHGFAGDAQGSYQFDLAKPLAMPDYFKVTK